MEAQEDMKDVTATCEHTTMLDGLCKKCKIYLCSQCQVADHYTHIEEIRGLDSLLTEAIGQYSRMGATLEKDIVSSKSSVKDGAIDSVLLEVEKRIADEYDKLTKDIQDLQEEQVAAFSSNPLVSKLQHDQELLSGEELTRLAAFDHKLGQTISTLLSALAEEKYEGVVGLLSEQTKVEYMKEAERFEGYYDRQQKFKKDFESLRTVRPKLAYNSKTIEELVQIRGVHEELTKLVLYEAKTNAVYVHIPKAHRVGRCETNRAQAPRKPAQARLEDHSLLLCGGKTKPKNYTSAAWVFDIVHKQARDVASMLMARAYHGIASKLDLEVFVAGGENATGLLNLAERYDVKADRWTPLPNLLEAKRNLTLCLCGEKHLYAIGGLGSHELASIEYLQVVDGHAWEPRQLARAPVLQKAAAVAVADNQILVFGGKAFGSHLQQTYLYDLPNATVIPKAALPIAATNISFNKSDNRKVETLVYATGNHKGQTFVYDTKADEWTLITNKQYQLSYNLD
jgi:hypothetical protein